MIMPAMSGWLTEVLADRARLMPKQFIDAGFAPQAARLY
jgi:hypothetical protein